MTLPQPAFPLAPPPPPPPIAESIKRGGSFIQSLGSMVEVFELIGSASYMPDRATDVDFAVLLMERCNAIFFADALAKLPDPWFLCGDYDTKAGEWTSVRHHGMNVNLMLTHSRKFYDGYLIATEVCKVLRLEDKTDRINVCKIVRDGMKAHQVVGRLYDKDGLAPRNRVLEEAAAFLENTPYSNNAGVLVRELRR